MECFVRGVCACVTCSRVLRVVYCVLLYGVFFLFLFFLCGCVVDLFVWCAYDLFCAVVWIVFVLLCMCACGVKCARAFCV